MSRSQRRNDPEKELSWLEKRHKQLSDQAALFETKRVLSPDEQMDLQKIKKQKLATKDAIFRMTQLS